MAVSRLNIDEFLLSQSFTHTPIIDVRAPKEYSKGHIPGAVNVPLFTDYERHIVGLTYKQKGKDDAFTEGLKFVGPKMADFVEKAKKLSTEKKLRVHCWRGGMRSQSLAWLWDQAGFEVHTLRGGYKAYRQTVHEDFARPYKIIILGGKTGSGKTEILYHLREKGEQIIDLEGIANHKGSAFGGLNQPAQPTNEQFENNLHQELLRLDPGKRIWVEDESVYIGSVFIPAPFWDQMTQAPVLVVEIPHQARIDRLVEDYADYNTDGLADAIERISKRLGGLATKQAMEALEQKNFGKVADFCLHYYDKAYMHAVEQRPSEKLQLIDMPDGNPEKCAEAVIAATYDTSFSL